MASTEPTKEEIMAVFPTVAATIADALGCDTEEVTLEASLVEDLDAESIDFLDLVFRLERGFKLKIPRGKVVEEARGDTCRGSLQSPIRASTTIAPHVENSYKMCRMSCQAAQIGTQPKTI